MLSNQPYHIFKNNIQGVIQMKYIAKFLMAGLFLSMNVAAIAVENAASADQQPAPATEIADANQQTAMPTQAQTEQAKPATAADKKVNINDANEEAIANVLKEMKGMKEKKAKEKAAAIVIYRNKHGKFKTLDDLAKVQGLKHFVKKHKEQIEVKFTL